MPGILLAASAKPAGGTPFDPASLSNLVQLGRVGYAVTNSRIWQNDVTTLATTDGQRVGAIREEVGNYYLKAREFDGGSYDQFYRGYLRNDSGTWCVETAGTGALILNTSDGFTFDVGTACHEWVWIKSTASGSNYTYLDFGGRELIETLSSISNNFRYRTTNQEWSINSGFAATGGWDLIQCWRTGGTAYIQFNNQTPVSGSAAFGTSTGTSVSLFSRISSAQRLPSGVRISQWGLRSVAPTSGERSSLYAAGPGS